MTSNQTARMLARITKAHEAADREKRNTLIVQAHEEGVSVAALADHLGFSTSGIRRLLTPQAPQPYVKQYDRGYRAALRDIAAIDGKTRDERLLLIEEFLTSRGVEASA